MHLVANTRTEFEFRPEMSRPSAARANGGLLGWLLDVVGLLKSGGWFATRKAVPKQMRILETLAVGAKKQLLLVSCSGERFLVGTGPDAVQTIIWMGSELGASSATGVSLAAINRAEWTR